MVLTVIRSAGTDALIGANDLENARLETLAEAGVNIGILHLVDSRWARTTSEIRFKGDPTICGLDDSIVELVIEDENGKVDLNAAPTALLVSLFVAGGASKETAREIAASTVDFRSASNSAWRSRSSDPGTEPNLLSPKHELFESTLELQQVKGMTGELFRTISRYVTVHSRMGGLDVKVASPDLLSALAFQRTGRPPEEAVENNPSRLQPSAIPDEFLASGASNSFLIRAKILGSHQSVFVREAIVEFPVDDPRRLFIREWRRGTNRYSVSLDSNAKKVLPPC